MRTIRARTSTTATTRMAISASELREFPPEALRSLGPPGRAGEDSGVGGGSSPGMMGNRLRGRSVEKEEEEIGREGNYSHNLRFM